MLVNFFMNYPAGHQKPLRCRHVYASANGIRIKDWETERLCSGKAGFARAVGTGKNKESRGHQTSLNFGILGFFADA